MEFRCKKKGATDTAKCYACYQKLNPKKRPASRVVCKNENKVTTLVTTPATTLVTKPIPVVHSVLDL